MAQLALLQLFYEIQNLDGENDGYIGHAEMRVLLERLNIHFTAKRFEDAFSLFDTDADGRFNLIEFHSFIFPSTTSEVCNLLFLFIELKANMIRNQHLYNCFSKYDRND